MCADAGWSCCVDDEGSDSIYAVGLACSQQHAGGQREVARQGLADVPGRRTRTIKQWVNSSQCSATLAIQPWHGCWLLSSAAGRTSSLVEAVRLAGRWLV